MNWMTQTSFSPPLIVVGVKADAGTFTMLKDSGKFAVSVLGTGQKDLAFAFFRHVEPEDGKFGDYAYESGTTGAPIMKDAPAWFECNVKSIVEEGDHAIVIAEVIEAGVREETKVLTLEECGVNYGG